MKKEELTVVCAQCEARITTGRKNGLPYPDLADVARQGWGLGQVSPGLYIPACPAHAEKPCPIRRNEK